MKAVSAAILVSSLLLTLLAETVSASDAPPPGYRVVVHPANPATAAERTFLQDAFLKRVKRWPHGKAVSPIDLAAASPARQRFSKHVLRRTVAAVRAYWQQKIFGGQEVPPPELGTDADVVARVLKNEGAVGYVSGTADIRGAKALPVVD